MSAAMARLKKTRLEAAGVDWYAHPDRPVLPLEGPRGVYQPVHDPSAIFFIRYGPGATVDEYVGCLGDPLTEAVVVRDESALLGGQAARLVEVVLTTAEHTVYRIDDRSGPVDQTVPAAPVRIHVVGAASHGVPVLVGYRLPEEAPPEVESLLREMLGRVSLS